MWMRIMSYYAVATGRKVGIFNTWVECQQQVTGFSGAKFKKFKTQNEATDFIKQFSTGPIPKTLNTTNNTQTSGSQITHKPQILPLPNKKYYHYTHNQLKKDTNKVKTEKTTSENDDTVWDGDSDGFDDLSFDETSKILKEVDKIEKKTQKQAVNVTKKMDKIEKAIDRGNLRISKLYEKAAKDANTSLDHSKKRTILIDQSELSPPPMKKIKQDDKDFSLDANGFVEVYTDGSCWKNGTSQAKAGLGVYFGENHRLNASEPVSGRATNNCGEIQAATKAIKLAHREGVTKLCIKTDSKFLINSATKWMKNWKKKDWKLASGDPVKNVVDFKELDSVMHLLQIKWEYVQAHNGLLGNERADELAKCGAQQYKL